jgi:alpha-L-fucosidase
MGPRGTQHVGGDCRKERRIRSAAERDDDRPQPGEAGTQVVELAIQIEIDIALELPQIRHAVECATTRPGSPTTREDRREMGTPRRADVRWWDRRRFGLLVQASTASVPAWAPIGQYAEWYRAHLDGDVCDTLLHPSPMVETIAHHRDRWAHVEHYDDFVEFLTFDEFDPDEWAEIARDAGMSYTVMVAKHHDGLCWWDAPNTDRTVVAAGPRRNVLAEYAAACERAELVFGTYYSLLDWSDPRYPTNEYVEQVVHPHVLDLVGRYGSQMLWGDGHWGGGGSHWRSDELIAAARERNPSILVNDRWWSDGPGVRSFEYRLPPTILEAPWEMRRGLGGSFGYNRAERAEHMLSPRAIVTLLTEVVAKG